MLSAVGPSRDGRGRSRPTGKRSSRRTKAGGAAGGRPGALTSDTGPGAGALRPALGALPGRPCSARASGVVCGPLFPRSHLSLPFLGIRPPLPHFSASLSLSHSICFAPHPLCPGSVCVLFCLQVALPTSRLLSASLTHTAGTLSLCPEVFLALCLWGLSLLKRWPRDLFSSGGGHSAGVSWKHSPRAAHGLHEGAESYLGFPLP